MTDKINHNEEQQLYSIEGLLHERNHYRSAYFAAISPVPTSVEPVDEDIDRAEAAKVVEILTKQKLILENMIKKDGCVDQDISDLAALNTVIHMYTVVNEEGEDDLPCGLASYAKWRAEMGQSKT